MANWNLEAAAGAPGASMFWRGTWSSALSYNPRDAVSASNGSSYVSKTNNQNKDPVSNPTDWDLIASGGAQGPQGIQGIQGVQGPAGPPNILTVASTSTGGPGTNAAVSIAGTSPSQSLSFTIPQGIAGPKGDKGDMGTFRLPPGYMSGLTMLNGGDTVNDIGVLTGYCRDDMNIVDMYLPALIYKQVDVIWAPNTGAGSITGGRDTGAVADGTWHIYLISKVDGTTDMVMTQTYNAPTMPSGFVYRRRLGSIYKSGAGGFFSFAQSGEYFFVSSAPSVMYDGQFAPGQSGNFGMTWLPTGKNFLVQVAVRQYNLTAGQSGILVRSPNMGNTVSATVWSYGSGYSNTNECNILCSGSMVIYVTTAPASSVTHIFIDLLGYWDLGLRVG